MSGPPTRMDAGDLMRRFGVPMPDAPHAASDAQAPVEAFPVAVGRYHQRNFVRPVVVGCLLLAGTTLPGAYAASLALLDLPSPSPAATTAMSAYVLASSVAATMAFAMAAWRVAW